MHSEREKWLRVFRPNPTAQTRLLCLPYGGGGASIFRTWPAALPDFVEIWGVELPGRETRSTEPLFESLERLVGVMANAIEGALDKPFAVYGHSLGAIVGFALVRELRRRTRLLPYHLFVSGRRAPHLFEPSPMHRLTNASSSRVSAASVVSLVSCSISPS